MRILRASDEPEMVAVFLGGELSSERFGEAVRDALAALGEPEWLVTHPDLRDKHANRARAAVLRPREDIARTVSCLSTFRRRSSGCGRS